jgi:hypothetical protein
MQLGARTADLIVSGNPFPGRDQALQVGVERRQKKGESVRNLKGAPACCRA